MDLNFLIPSCIIKLIILIKRKGTQPFPVSFYINTGAKYLLLRLIEKKRLTPKGHKNLKGSYRLMPLLAGIGATGAILPLFQTQYGWPPYPSQKTMNSRPTRPKGPRHGFGTGFGGKQKSRYPTQQHLTKNGSLPL